LSLTLAVLLGGVPSWRDARAQRPAPEATSEQSATARDTAEAGSATSSGNDSTRGIAVSEALRMERVEIGLAQTWKIGHWTPVRVTLASGSSPVKGRLSLILPDSDG